MKKESKKGSFIDLANDESGVTESFYNYWPKELTTDSSQLPALQGPIAGINLFDSLLNCIGSDLKLSPDRMLTFITLVRTSIRKIIEDLIQYKIVTESEELKSFINLKERLTRKYIVSNGRLYETTDTLDDDRWKIALTPKWLSDVTDSLIDFLLNGEFLKLKKCTDCTKFFPATKNNPRQKYCSVCSKKNHTPLEEQAKRTRASREAAKKRKEKRENRDLYERQYNRLLKSGYSTKEATQWAKEYVIEQRSEIE